MLFRGDRERDQLQRFVGFRPKDRRVTLLVSKQELTRSGQEDRARPAVVERHRTQFRGDALIALLAVILTILPAARVPQVNRESARCDSPRSPGGITSEADATLPVKSLEIVRRVSTPRRGK